MMDEVPDSYADFKMWLEQHDRFTKAEALEELVAAGIPDFDADDWVLRRAAKIRSGEMRKPRQSYPNE